MVLRQAHGPGGRALLRAGGGLTIAAAAALPAAGAAETATAVAWLAGLVLLLVSFRSPGRGRYRRRT